MSQVNIYQAKCNLSRLVASLEDGSESEIIIAKNGRPVAKMVKFDEPKVSKRIGMGKGRFHLTEAEDKAFDKMDAEIARMFGV